MINGIILVMIANVINMILGVINSFILPKYLSIDTYATIKTYALYLGYAGFFHLGFCDGMYLKYGGKKLEDIPSKELSNNFRNYLYLSITSSIIIFIIAYILKINVLIAFSIGMICSNIIDYYRALYQAVGEFKLYGRVINLQKFLLLIADLILIFIIGTNFEWSFIGMRIIIPMFVAIFLGYELNKKVSYLKGGKFSKCIVKENISSGFILMLGNFSTNIFTGLDRWFVNILMSTTNFAMYAFAVSLENIINVFITPITVSMYNSFCNNCERKRVIRIKQMLLIWAFIVIAAAYPAKLILEKFLTKYITANSIIFILFAGQAFQIIIKGVYVNLYKANKQQKKYLNQMLAMLIVAFGLNGILFFIFRSMESIAVGTLITSIIWLIICEVGEKEIKFQWNEVLAIIIIINTYIVTGIVFNSIVGCIIYMLVTIITIVVLMKSSLIDIIIAVRKFTKSIIKKKKLV